MKRVILIRHGETDYTLKGRRCGQRDIPLSQKGARQAGELHDLFKKMMVDSIYCSDLKRSYQTAQIVFRGKHIKQRKMLREIDFGSFAGLTYAQIKRKYPRAYKIFKKRPMDSLIPSGENMSDFAERITKAIDSILNKEKGKTVALVCHIHAIRIMILHLIKEDFNNFWELTIILNNGKF